jgi:hypothetical protein
MLVLNQAAENDAYWLRTFASAAMQGILVSCNDPHNDWPLADRVAKVSVAYAQALLAEVKNCEAEND